VTNKNVIYFQDVKSEACIESNSLNYTPTFHTDDLLSITVSSLDIESTTPFNIQMNQSTSSNATYTSGSPMPNGYLIDKDGMIDFPIIGKIKIAGLDRNEAIELLKNQLSVYIKKPIVNIRILNYKITVIGEVSKPGTFTIPNERITILEAIGIAGDLTITGKRNNVLIIRDIDGQKINFRVDLTKNELFKSPVYYLNQNDVVYVEPNRTKINSSAINPSNAGIIISSISLFITTIVLLSK
jgi:polysaccharide export outer membrane protein